MSLVSCSLQLDGMFPLHPIIVSGGVAVVAVAVRPFGAPMPPVPLRLIAYPFSKFRERIRLRWQL